ncbi:hypothetical protein IWQ62_004210 [Dispira parvispora]|uniref:t-SNARE coiled-coil homology domain-containing protein n=1 Tax=Dispira parvispora TaxID=1520584 RepID=A0A9W8AM22_9FUNG|nr:hypothetical protein IWQ62_004210 [Dispira parvispora]
MVMTLPSQHPYSHRARRADWNIANEAHTSSSRYGEQRYFDEPTQTEEPRPPPTLQGNDGHVDHLRSKLGVLKDITLNIGHEIRDQNAFLGQMDHDFQATGNRLAATMKRFYRMAATQGGAYMWLLCLFAVGVCIFLYLYLKWLALPTAFFRKPFPEEVVRMMLFTEAHLAKHSQAIQVLKEQSTIDQLVVAVRFIKNHVIGSGFKKQLYLDLDLVPLLIRWVQQVADDSHSDTGLTEAQSNLIGHSLVVLGSLTYDTSTGLATVLEHDIVRVLCRFLCASSTPSNLLLIVVNTLKTVLTQLRWVRSGGINTLASTLTPSAVGSQHTKAVDRSLVSAKVLVAPSTAPEGVHDWPSPSTSSRDQSADPAAGNDGPQPLGEDDPVFLPANALAVLVDLLDLSSTDPVRRTYSDSTRLALAEAAALVLTQYFQLVTLNTHVEPNDSTGPLSSTTASMDSPAPQECPNLQDFTVMEQARVIYLLVRLVSLDQLRVQAAALDALAALIRDRAPLARLLVHTPTDPTSPMLSLDRITQLFQEPVDVCALSSPHPVVERINSLITSADVTVQTLAATCLTLLYRAQVVPNYEAVISQRVAPTLVRLLRGYCFRRDADGMVNNVLWDAEATQAGYHPGESPSPNDGSPRLLGEFIGYNYQDQGRGGTFSWSQTVGRRVGTATMLAMQIPVVLAYLTADHETMQEACCDAGAASLLTDILCKLNQPTSSPGSEDQQPTVADPSMSDVDRLKEGILIAIAALCSQSEMCREKMASRSLTAIVRALGHPHPNVRIAACQCIRSLSRSVKLLRTQLLEASVGEPLYRLVDDPYLAVQLSAMDALCNVVLDFSPLRQTVLDLGIVDRFTELALHANWDVQIRAVWVLKNLLFKAVWSTAEKVMAGLTYDGLARLVLSQHIDIERQALGLLRNLAAFSPKGNGHILHGFGKERFLELLSATLDPAYPDLLEEALYVCVNFSSGHPGHKTWMLQQPSLMNSLVTNLKSTNPKILQAALWWVANLITVDSENHDGPAEGDKASVESEDKGLDSARNERNPFILDHSQESHDVHTPGTAMETDPDERSDGLRSTLPTLGPKARAENLEQLGVDRLVEGLVKSPHLNVSGRAQSALACFSKARSLATSSSPR